MTIAMSKLEKLTLREFMDYHIGEVRQMHAHLGRTSMMFFIETPHDVIMAPAIAADEDQKELLLLAIRQVMTDTHALRYFLVAPATEKGVETGKHREVLMIVCEDKNNTLSAVIPVDGILLGETEVHKKVVTGRFAYLLRKRQTVH